MNVFNEVTLWKTFPTINILRSGERLPFLNVGSMHDSRAQPVAFNFFRMPSQLSALNYFALLCMEYR